MFDYKFIKIEIDGFKAILTLNRPEKRNAFTITMVNEIYHAFQFINHNDIIKIVVIKAEGAIFCAGMDLGIFENPELDVQNPNIINKDISLGEVFESLHKPSIAIVEGNVIAGGLLIILGCTYVFSNPGVQFRLPELMIGIFPFQVMLSLLKVLPEKKVLQLCFDTEYFDTEKAISLGIVDGYLDNMELEYFIQRFDGFSIKAMKAGIASLRSLNDIEKKNQFKYLKQELEKLKL